LSFFVHCSYGTHITHVAWYDMYVEHRVDIYTSIHYADFFLSDRGVCRTHTPPGSRKYMMTWYTLTHCIVVCIMSTICTTNKGFVFFLFGAPPTYIGQACARLTEAPSPTEELRSEMFLRTTPSKVFLNFRRHFTRNTG